MIPTRSVALLVLVAAVGLTVAPLTSAAVVNPLADAGQDDGSETDTDVSAFMQSSAADAENTVESGMFEAKYEAADDERRADIVTERTDELEERLATLEAERETLREQRDELHQGEYRARMTQLTVEIRALERSIDRTEQRAAESGVDTERLDELRTGASKLAGPEVAEIARGLAGLDEAPGGGPPEDRGNGNGDARNDGNRGQGQENGQSARQSDSGPPHPGSGND